MDREIEILARIIYNVNEKRKKNLIASSKGIVFDKLPHHEKITFYIKAEKWLEVLNILRVKKEDILEKKLKKFYGYPPYDGMDNIVRGDRCFYKSIESEYSYKAMEEAYKRINQDENVSNNKK